MTPRLRLFSAFTLMAFLLPATGVGKGEDSYLEAAMKFVITGAVASVIIPIVDAKSKAKRAAADEAAGRPQAPARPRAGEARRVINVRLEPAVAFDRALAAVSAIRRVQVRETDREAGTIKAVTGPTLASMGEKIEVTWSAKEDGRLEIEIASLSKLFAASADREKNEDNVRRIAEAIQINA